MSSPPTATVKAWTYHEAGYPSTLKLSSVEVPSTPPSPTHIIVKPHAVSLNPVDIQLMNLPLNNLPGFVPFLGGFAGTKIAGKDFSGEVIAAGSESGFQVGDKVMGLSMGGPQVGFLTEAVAVDVLLKAGLTVIKKPAHLNWVKAASLPCVWLTAKTCVEKCVPFIRDQETLAANKVVVLGGSSSTGIYSIRLTKQKGWTVLASCSGRNIDFVRSLGADEVVDYTISASAVLEAVSEFRPDAIIDCVGGVETIGLAKQYVTIVGDKTSRSTMGGSALYLTRPKMVLRWLMGYLGLGNSYECIILESSAGNLQDVNDLKEDDVIVDSVFEFSKAKEAFERLNTGRARGKVVVEVAGKV